MVNLTKQIKLAVAKQRELLISLQEETEWDKILILKEDLHFTEAHVTDLREIMDRYKNVDLDIP
ncbi:hypothetical protein LCGC14_0572800 [marine sediment metagenome]|uniref:Uncharacterized protein n=1 Tax=marine sediment metagenome TaxID=412755 RepID=A0A0F9RNT8_9ZZZZ